MFKLSELSTTAHSAVATPTLYDPFLFVDSLTNRSIPVKNIRKNRNSQAHTQRNHPPRFSEQQQIQELDQCLTFLRSTMAFKMSVLREKLFGQGHKHNKGNQGEQRMLKKRLIRTVLVGEIEEKNREELRIYLNSEDHRPDPNLLKVSRSSNFSISKKTISKIMSSLQKKETLNVYLPKHANDQAERDPYVLRLNRLSGELKDELREKLRKSGQFLIQPQSHFISSKALRKTNIRSSINGDKQNGQFSKLKWTPVTLSSQNLKRGRKARIQTSNHTLSKQQADLLKLVGNGSVQDVQVFASKCRRQILRIRDNNGNNLMHIAATNNKSASFQWLFRMLGVEGLLQKNEEGQTPVDVAVKYGYREVLNLIPRSMM